MAIYTKKTNVGKSNFLCCKIMQKIVYCFCRHACKEGKMEALFERIKKARTDLHLSQDYVARFLGISRTAVVEIESNRRKVSADELGKFSELFQIPADELLNGRKVEMPVQMFARRFGSLDEADQQEILNLIEFKRMMKERG